MNHVADDLVMQAWKQQFDTGLRLVETEAQGAIFEPVPRRAFDLRQPSRLGRRLWS